MVDLVLSPLAWLVLAVLGFGAAGWLPHPMAWRAASVSLALVALAASTPLFANALVGRLERDAVAKSCAGTPSTIVVLAGGVDLRASGPADFGALNAASRRRMDRAISAWRATPGSRLLLSGGASARHAPALAGLMSAYAQWAGVPPASIQMETSSLDTWQSAREVAGMLPGRSRIALVTSAMHWPRARTAFLAAGLRPCALVADVQRLPTSLPWALIPRLGALEKTEGALHELLGHAWYRWRARSA